MSYHQKPLTNPRLYRFLPLFSSRSFIVLHFTRRYMVHFELISCKVEGLCLGLFFCMGMSYCLSFLHGIAFDPYQKSVDYNCVRLVIGSPFWSTALWVYAFAILSNFNRWRNHLKEVKWPSPSHTVIRLQSRNLNLCPLKSCRTPSLLTYSYLLSNGEQKTRGHSS